MSLSPLVTEYTIKKALDLDLDLVIHSETAIDFILSKTLPKPLDIWLKIDTGMHRLGISPTIAKRVYPGIIATPQCKYHGFDVAFFEFR